MKGSWARRPMRVVALVTACAVMTTGLAMAASAWAVATPTMSMGAASGYAIIARTSITNVGTTALIGPTGKNNVALSDAGTASWAVPGGSITGLELTSQADAAAGNAQIAASSASSYAMALIRDYWLGPTLNALTLTPGVYDASGAANMAASQTLTLDGQGNSNAVFVMRIHGALTLGAYGVVNLVNGAQPANVFWIVDGAVTMGAHTSIAGVMISPAAITLGANASVRGQVVSTSGAITLDSNTITNTSSPPGTSTPTATSSATPTTTVSSTASPSASGSGAVVVWLDDRLSGDLKVGVPYSDELSVSSSLAPAVEINSAVFSVSAGILPTGMSLEPSTGVISGTPGATGTFPFTIEASIAGLPRSSRHYVLTTSAVTSPATVWIDHSLASDATVGTSFGDRLTAGSADQPTIENPNVNYFVDFGALPPGLTLTDGILHGTPTVPGVYLFGIDAKVPGHSVATETFIMRVADRNGQVASAAPGSERITTSDIASARVIYRMRRSGKWVVVPRFLKASKSIPVYAHFTVVRSPVGRQSKNIPAARAKAKALANANQGRTGPVIKGKLWRGPARIIVNW